ncbi:uncharacterized protein LOC113229447 isoform X2 [Hyposmocoma kahamanoa]|uniref:uncharacterized protein LOC113229447 isoform X2 n=1 Tax=Hyposmocoma kahamanoa TaxID=1477025 RepID=UPI000E6D8D68|nr:uncharacterized protein LOC113229447 isoform X2 [Hyposmocoma kahamanoa]
MLPQLAVSAKILCLLMVVICGAVPSMVRSVRLYSRCSHMFVNVLPNGTVMAHSNVNDQPNLTLIGGKELELLIYSPIQDMYLCFNRSRLIGRQMTRDQAERQQKCIFKEEFLNGYNRYKLAKYPQVYIGFNHLGMPMRYSKNRPMKPRCTSFLKGDYGFDITNHNLQVSAGENAVYQRPQRRLRPPPQNSIKNCHGIRHRHGRHSRRKNCHGT